jgi:hypothetical protein
MTKKNKTVVIWDENNREILAVVGLWFTLYLFYPQTHIFLS